jgi:hypothetical protein
MKKSIFILFLLAGSLQLSYAQYGVLALVKPEKVKSTETIIVFDYDLPENKQMEEPLENALKKTWTVSGYKIMTRKAVLANIKQYNKPNYSFIYIQYEKIIKYGLTNTDRTLLMTYAINNNAEPGNLPPVTAIAKTELNYDICNLEAELMKDFLIIQDQIKKGLFKFGDADPVLKTRTLLIPVALIGKMTAEEIAKVYPYQFQIVTKEELSKAIINRTLNTCFIEHTHIPQSMFTVTDIDTGDVLYHGVAEAPVYGFGKALKVLKDHIK